MLFINNKALDMSLNYFVNFLNNQYIQSLILFKTISFEASYETT